MKLEFFESKFVTSITLVPENTEEVAQLARMVKSSKREVPHMRLSFYGEKINAEICMPKISEKKQENHYTNKKP